MTKKCIVCEEDFTHATRCEYTCYHCNNDVCIECIEAEMEEGTGHVFCPECGKQWADNTLTQYYSAFQMRLLNRAIERVRIPTKRRRLEETKADDMWEPKPRIIMFNDIIKNLLEIQTKGALQSGQTIVNELNEKEILYYNRLTPQERDKLNDSYVSTMKDSLMDMNKPIIFQLLENGLMPDKVRGTCISMLKSSKQASPETQSKYMEWIQGIMKIPFGVVRPLPVTLAGHGEIACGTFLESAYQRLNECMYGMDSVKLQIIQMIGLWLVNPDAASQPLGLCGPAGVGKTSILRNGIARILERPFAMIPLGGVSDSRQLKGFEMTYIGSQCGRIAEILQETRVMNPIILFDEVDKVGTKNGADEVSAALIHITDRTSNTDFQDIYFRGVSFDISKSLLTFSMNDLQAVNPILRNRMHIIHVPAYKKTEKLEILKRHIIPRVETEFNMRLGLNDDTLRWFIDKYDEGEGGVRMLIRATENLYARLNVIRMKKDILKMGAININELNNETIQKIMSLFNEKGKDDEWWKQLYV